MTILKKLLKLKDYWDNGQIPTIVQHEVNPGFAKNSRDNYLYFTLPPCINFQRNSPAMWQSALKTYDDPQTRYVFYPEQVVKADYEQFKADMAKYNLALLRNKHCEIWFKICETLYMHYESNPIQVLEEAEYDVRRILRLLQVEKRELFKHLRGTKLSNYWLMILDQYTDVKLKNKQMISIIPDTHIIQASFMLGICEENEKPEKVAELWFELLKDSDLAPVSMHPILWNWSRNNFKPEV